VQQLTVPPLPEGRTAILAGRGEMFFRHHPGVARSTDAPVLLLHGWTASADTQFFSAYGPIGERYAFVAPDHRGHGRGIRAVFTIEDAADDAAALLRHLDLGPVIALGYSMGGPIALHLARRNPELVAGIVVQATALEWRGSAVERFGWRFVGLAGAGLRSRWYRRAMRLVLRRLVRDEPSVRPLLPWVEGELMRSDPVGVVQAGRSLSRYDARGWASRLDVPAAMLITTNDHVVVPRKQRALADALGATTRELAADHLCPLTEPEEYARLTRELLDEVQARLAR
jgi:pimeloyl-ACP methyl ester carboxylesterase